MNYLAIPTIAGTVSTGSFSDFVQSVGPLAGYKGLRLVIQTAVGWNVVNLARLALSAKDAPVAQYSSAVFDTSVNQTKVSRVVSSPHHEIGL